MIFNTADIQTFHATEKVADLVISKTAKIHTPSGVYFMMSTNAETNEFLYFSVAAMNSKSEPVDKKTFEAKTQKEFFEAVDYFERLIQNRMPEEKQKPPSMGQFVYLKGLDCVVLAFGVETKIDYTDVPKVFTPPLKKPYGRLNMMAVDKDKYEIIKAKFALNFNQESTDEWKAKYDITDVIVYDMSAYQTSKPEEGEEQEKDPESVSDDELTADQIEGEDEESMKGSDKEESEESDSDKDGEKSDSEDGDEQSESDKKGEKSDSDKETEKSDSDEESEKGEREGQEAQEDMMSKEDNEEGQETVEGYKKQLIVPSPAVVMDKLNKAFGVDDVVTNFKRQSVMINQLQGWSDDEIKDTFYEPLGTPRNTDVREFIEELKSFTKPYFE